MRVLVDLTHPADVHLFRNLVRALEERGHDVHVTARDKDVTLELLSKHGIRAEIVSREGAGLAGKAVELIRRDWKLVGVARRFRPDVMISRGGISIGHVGAVLRIPTVVVDDTEHAKLQLALTVPFVTRICTGTGYTRDWGRRQVRFRGFPMLAYLSPEYFRVDPRALLQAGVDPEADNIVIRLVSWDAAHDMGLRGASVAEVESAVSRLSRYGRVLISSERELPESLRQYRNPVPIDHIHSLLSVARLYLGEGGTMAAEAAGLGCPSVYCNPLECGYISSLEQDYGLIHTVRGLSKAVEIGEWLLGRSDLPLILERRRQKMLDESEDVVEFLFRQCEELGSGKVAG